jgi:hypothetical protein
MIIFGGLLFAFGMTLLAIGFALSLIRLAVLIVAGCFCVVAVVVSGSVVLVMKVVQWFMPRQPEAGPGITINIYINAD